MDSFKDFYNGLDILNLILFWGIIVVIALIIIFLILYFSRKKSVSINTVEDDFDDIDIIKFDNSNLNIKTIPDDDVEVVNREINLEEDTIEIPIQKKQVKMEINDHLSEDNSKNDDIVIEKKNNIEYDFKDNEVDVIEKNNVVEVKESKDSFLFDELVRKDDKPRAYHKNVFREMNSRNQTSPIGIVYDNHINEIDEYKESLNDKNDNYLENVYSSLSNATVPDKIALTDYEKRQEENAVISYSELLKKKDSINFDHEEDAVISYSELLNKENKLYNIREEEEDKEFLSELKKFRRDL